MYWHFSPNNVFKKIFFELEIVRMDSAKCIENNYKWYIQGHNRLFNQRTIFERVFFLILTHIFQLVQETQSIDFNLPMLINYLVFIIKTNIQNRCYKKLIQRKILLLVVLKKEEKIHRYHKFGVGRNNSGFSNRDKRKNKTILKQI